MASRRLPLGLSLFLLFQGLYGLCASGRVGRVPDEFEVYLQVESLWDRGTQAMPPWIGEAFFGREGRGGARYAPYGPGLAFTALPHHALGRGLAAAAGVEPPRLTATAYHPAPTWTHLVAGCTSLASSTWAALAVWGLFTAALALGAAPRRAAWTAAALGVGSLLFPYGTLFFSEPVSAALLIWALAWHLRGASGLAALCMLGLGVMKATNLIYAPALLCLALPTRRDPALRRAVLYGVALVAAGLIHMEWNRHRFGNPLEFGYDWSETIQGPPRPFDPARLPTALFGLLLSPGKSVFLFTPALLLVLAPARLRALVTRRRDLALALGVATLTAFAFYGTYMFWEGGYCPGPRHLVPLLPAWLLALSVGPAPTPGPARACLVGGAALGLLLSSVSYLEDQAIGVDALREGGQANEAYYRIDPAPAPGQPANVYQLGYSPLRSYPTRLVKHTVDPPERVGEGLEFFRAHLSRVVRSIPGAQPLPGWLPWLLTLGLGAAYALGLAGCWRRCDRSIAPEAAQAGGC